MSLFGDQEATSTSVVTIHDVEVHESVRDHVGRRVTLGLGLVDGSSSMNLEGRHSGAPIHEATDAFMRGMAALKDHPQADEALLDSFFGGLFAFQGQQVNQRLPLGTLDELLRDTPDTTTGGSTGTIHAYAALLRKLLPVIQSLDVHGSRRLAVIIGTDGVPSYKHALISDADWEELWYICREHYKELVEPVLEEYREFGVEVFPSLIGMNSDDPDFNQRLSSLAKVLNADFDPSSDLSIDSVVKAVTASIVNTEGAVAANAPAEEDADAAMAEGADE